jgi:hypothetical protein
LCGISSAPNVLIRCGYERPRPQMDARRFASDAKTAGPRLRRTTGLNTRSGRNVCCRSLGPASGHDVFERELQRELELEDHRAVAPRYPTIRIPGSAAPSIVKRARRRPQVRSQGGNRRRAPFATSDYAACRSASDPLVGGLLGQHANQNDVIHCSFSTRHATIPPRWGAGPAACTYRPRRAARGTVSRAARRATIRFVSITCPKPPGRSPARAGPECTAC